MARTPVVDAALIARELGIRTQNAYPLLRDPTEKAVLTAKNEYQVGTLWRSEEVLQAIDRFAKRASRRQRTEYISGVIDLLWRSELFKVVWVLDGGDITLADIVNLIWFNGRVIDATRTAAPNAWRRQLHLMLDAYRSVRAHPIPEPPMIDAQLYDAMVDLGAAD